MKKKDNSNLPDCVATRKINLYGGYIVLADPRNVIFKLLQHGNSCSARFVVSHACNDNISFGQVSSNVFILTFSSRIALRSGFGV